MSQTPEPNPSHPEPDTTTPAGETPTLAGDAVDLLALIAERDEYKERLARSVADLANYRKRMQRDLEDERKYQASSLLRAILQPLDGLQRAIKAAQTSGNAEELIGGVGMVLKQFEAALTNQGVTVIPAVGQPFDPNLHEAITQAPSADHPPMTVLDDIETGYKLHDRVIRPSRVIVSIAPPA